MTTAIVEFLMELVLLISKMFFLFMMSPYLAFLYIKGDQTRRRNLIEDIKEIWRDK